MAGYLFSRRSTPFWLILLTVLVMGMKSTPVHLLFPQADKLYHGLAFASLAFAARWAFPECSWRRLLASLLGCALAIEWVQTLEPARTASLTDMLANLLGMACGLLAIRLLGRYYPSSQSGNP